MDISKSLTYASEDKEWLTKLGVGTLISFVPVLNLAYHGYLVEMLRNVADRRPLPLPTWDNLEKKFLEGLKLALAQFVYGLPAFILFFVPVLFVLPAFFDNQDVQTILVTVGGAVTLGLICILGLYLLAFSFVVPAIQLNFARKGTFGSCFQFGEIIGLIRANTSDYLTAWLATLGIGAVLYIAIAVVISVVNFIPCIGFIFSLVALPFTVFAGVWFGTVHAYLFGQVGAGAMPAAQNSGYISA